MESIESGRSTSNDPRRLRAFLARVEELARDHALPSVIVGIAGREGDRLLPELAEFVASALRVEDAVFRITRERALLLIADADRKKAEEILSRLLDDFRQRFPVVRGPDLSIGYFEVRPGAENVTVKVVLPTLFPPSSSPAAA